MITTIPVAADICICGHNGLAHDATSQVCRNAKDVSAPCGCVSFGYPGAITNRSSAVGNTPPLAGPSAFAVVPPAGNRNG